MFFRKTHTNTVEAPELEAKLHQEEIRLQLAGREFHKKKSVCGLTALELLLDGLRSGKITKEEL